MKENYEFIAIDEGKQNLLRGNTGGKGISWKRSLADYPTARALERLDGDRILIGYDRGYCIAEIDSGEIIHDCRRWTGVTSAISGPDGTRLITGLNLEGRKGVTVLTLDREDRVIDARSRRGNYVRLMARTEENLYLLSTNDRIRICTSGLQMKGTLAAKGFLHVWQSRVADDSILVSAGYGAFMARFSLSGKLVQVFGGKDSVPTEVEPFFYACFSIAEDKSILVANWQGHGPDNGQKGRQLLHFDEKGKYLESWSFPEEISSFQGLLLLE